MQLMCIDTVISKSFLFVCDVSEYVDLLGLQNWPI